MTGSTHSQRSQHLQAAHSFTLANSVALLRGTSPKQAFSISQSVSERCAGTVNTDEITKRIDGFIQQATLSRVLLVPIRVVPGVVWRNVRLATRRAKVPMCYLHKWNASCLQHVHCFTHPGEKPLLLLWGPASRKQTDVRNKVRQFLGRALLHWARRQFAHHAQRPIGDSSAVRFIGHDGFRRSARAHLQRPQPRS